MFLFGVEQKSRSSLLQACTSLNFIACWFCRTSGTIGREIACNLATLKQENLQVLSFMPARPFLKVIASSIGLCDLLVRFFKYSQLTIDVDPDTPLISFFAEDHYGGLQINVPTAVEFIDVCVCDNALTLTYTTNFIESLIRLEKIGSKCSLRIDHRGLLSIQLMIPMSTDNTFFEVLVPPMV